MFKKNHETETVTNKLRDFFVGIPNGEEVTWLRIEADTGIKMNALGRQRARSALGRLRRPHEAISGNGIRLSSAATSLAIMREKFVRIDGAVSVAQRVQRQLQDRHLEEMSGDEQRRMLMLAGFFGAIRTIAKQNAPLFLA